ncbi:MAG: hypothetical protein COB30_006760, partial [Ectothiorhodospiraceae bacterium]|nr:hypothetical protein [Ectothiorhodospiraceae bacterium]
MSAKLLLEQLKKGELSPAEGVKQFKQLKQAKQRQTEKQNSAELLFVHADWVDAPLQPVSKPTGDILVFDTTGDLIAELQRVWQQREGSGLAHTEVRWARVSPGARYAVDGDHYQLPVADAKSYTRLLDDLKAQGFRVGLIIHAWSNDTYSPEVLTEQLDSSIGSLFLLSQALLQQKLQQKQSETVEVQYVYRGQVGSVSPVYAALSGFARTVQLEAPHYHYKTIELAGTLVESSEKLLDEWGQR